MPTFEQIDALDPDDVGRRLINAGLFLLAAELIGDLVVRRVRSFYEHVTFGSGAPFKSYDVDVKARHKDIYQASLFWLRDHMEALTSEQVMDIQAVRTRRNALAHDLSTALLSDGTDNDEDLLDRARRALFSLSNLWVRMEIQADPEFQSPDIDWESVHSTDFGLLDRVIEMVREAKRTL